MEAPDLYGVLPPGVHSESFARFVRCPRNYHEARPNSDRSSAPSSRESSRAKSFPAHSNCGASSRLSSNNDWPGRAIRSKNRFSHMSCTARNDFDGGADPVVRVDARRLRDKLREYYEGRSDPVVISLPKGSYVPNLRKECRLTPPHGPSCPSIRAAAHRSSGAGANAFSPELQSQSPQDRRQRSGRRRCRYRRHASTGAHPVR